MKTQKNKKLEKKGQAVANSLSKEQNNSESAFQLVNNGPEGIAQRKLQQIAQNANQANAQPIQAKKVGITDETNNNKPVVQLGTTGSKPSGGSELGKKLAEEKAGLKLNLLSSPQTRAAAPTRTTSNTGATFTHAAGTQAGSADRLQFQKNDLRKKILSKIISSKMVKSTDELEKIFDTINKANIPKDLQPLADEWGVVLS